MTVKTKAVAANSETVTADPIAEQLAQLTGIVSSFVKSTNEAMSELRAEIATVRNVPIVKAPAAPVSAPPVQTVVQDVTEAIADAKWRELAKSVNVTVGTKGKVSDSTKSAILAALKAKPIANIFASDKRADSVTIVTPFGTITSKPQGGSGGNVRMKSEDALEAFYVHPERQTFDLIPREWWRAISLMGAPKAYIKVDGQRRPDPKSGVKAENPANLMGSDRMVAGMLAAGIINMRREEGEATPNQKLAGCEIIAKLKACPQFAHAFDNL